MAFFDSAKNRALWDKELESLDAERARRREEGYKPQHEGFRLVTSADTKEKGMYSDNPKVRRITLKELEEIEKKAREAEREAAAITNEPRKQREGMERRRAKSQQRSASAEM